MLTAQQATARLADLRTRNGKLTAEAVVHIAECQRLSQEFERVQSSIHQRDTEAVSSRQDGAEDSEERRYKSYLRKLLLLLSRTSRPVIDRVQVNGTLSSLNLTWNKFGVNRAVIGKALQVRCVAWRQQFGLLICL